MFDDYPNYPLYRTIEDRSPDPIGPDEDVFALQCAINTILPASLVVDGVCGPELGEAIWNVQRKLGITVDGKAGQETQRSLALKILGQRLRPWTTRYLLVLGIILKESSGWLGIYSSQRENGSYDAGACQMNSEHRDVRVAFDPTRAIPILIAETIDALGRYHDRKLFVGNDHTRRRRLSLAAGSWNAPAYANFLAGVRPWAEPSDAALATLENYMTWATALLDEK